MKRWAYVALAAAVAYVAGYAVGRGASEPEGRPPEPGPAPAESAASVGGERSAEKPAAGARKVPTSARETPPIEKWPRPPAPQAFAHPLSAAVSLTHARAPGGGRFEQGGGLTPHRTAGRGIHG